MLNQAPPVASILLIEPDDAQAELLSVSLKKAGHTVAWVRAMDDALAALKVDIFQLVIMDLSREEQCYGDDQKGMLAGLSQLKTSTAHPDRAPTHVPDVIVITWQGSIATAVEAMRRGAYDFLIKPIPAEKLLITVRNALERQTLSSTVAAYQHATHRDSFHGFIGSSPAMQSVYRMIESAAASKATVFVMGESGTGKEICAQSIHDLSARARGPFVALNCAAIPRDLMESEVFGHVKGAFTGATADREGAAKRANGGTLFLDEICEMDLNLQGKLLRFLQMGSFQRVGGSRVEEVDVRIVCATNRDPWHEVEAGRFREDLYFRLHVIPITLPPLRDRENDVLEIARSLLALYSQEEKKSFVTFTPESERILLNYDWPGNVRQLQNIVRNLVVLNQGTHVIPEMMPPPVGGRWARPQGFQRVATLPLSIHGRESLSGDISRIRPLIEVEREAIEKAITLCDGNVPKAAALLGVNPSTLYRKRQSWGVKD